MKTPVQKGESVLNPGSRPAVGPLYGIPWGKSAWSRGLFGCSVVCLMFLGPGLVQRCAASEPVLITLGDAIAAAMKGNFDLRMEELTLQDVETGVWVEEAAFYPSLRANAAGETGTTESQRVGVYVEKPFRSGLRLSVGSSLSSLQFGGETEFTADSGLRLAYPVFRGAGSFFATYRLDNALRDLEQARRSYRDRKAMLRFTVAQAYFDLVRKELTRMEHVKSLERMATLAKVNEAKIKAGLIAKIETYATELQILELRGALIGLDDEIAVAKSRLADVMGLSPELDFTVPLEVAYTPEPFDRAVLRQVVLDRHSDILDARAELTRARNAVAWEKNRLLPQLELWTGFGAVNHGSSIGDAYSYDDVDFRLGFTLAAEASPWATFASIQRVERSLAMKDYRIELVERRLTTHLDHLLARVRQLEHQISLEDTRTALAQKRVEMAEVLFQKGVGNLVDVHTAEEVLLRNNVQLINQRIEAVLAQMELKVFAGVLHEEF